jgi:UDP:flavonoid glycosyltransferase YjiC (YdhE family)
MEMEVESPDTVPQTQQHFLFVTCGLQGHINPVRRLAARVAAANPSARVTISTAVSAHRRMFPSLASPDEEVLIDGGVLYAPYSDGYDEGFDPGTQDAREYAARSRRVGRDTLSRVVSTRLPPVTRVVYTFLAAWALDVARARGVPAAHYWIQPATVLAVYYRCFRNHGVALASCYAGDRDTTVQLPGLPALRSDALPSIVAAAAPEHPQHVAFRAFRDLFADLDAHRPRVLVETFEALEPDALHAVPELEVVAVGPAVPDDAEEEGDYVRWLDAKAASSVVYVSFGSLVPMSERQEAEMERGLEAAGRPYLWARKGAEDRKEKEQGLVVSWCEQARVLSHAAVGCFVTHCGWNSALESVTCGVPVVAVPQWTDQPTVAWLLADCAGVGVRAQVAAADGLVGSAELQRCVETVMGDGGRAAEIRERVERWRELGRNAVAAGGSSERNLRLFAFGM